MFKVYSFGYNANFECGNGNNAHVLTPILNYTLENENTIDIKCGYNHNVVRSDDNKYHLWGDNYYNQCLTVFNAQIRCVYPGFYP